MVDPLSKLWIWQQRVLNEFYAARLDNYLVVATPGAGKTTLSGAIAYKELQSRNAEQIVVVVPSEQLKFQWHDKLHNEFDVQISPSWANGAGRLPSEFHGIAVTYQQVASSPLYIRKFVATNRTLLIADEIHHCGDTLTWGDALRHAFEPAVLRLLLSGTPFRSDNVKIPFVHYDEDGVARGDSTYGYGDALGESVCRPVFFPRRGGRMEWSDSDGDYFDHTFDDELADRQMNERLRTALSPHGEWIRDVLRDAHRELTNFRQEDPNAAGLVIASDLWHAEHYAKILGEVSGYQPVVATYDDKAARTKITTFRDSREPWIVAIKMVSEGVDIPRLRVGVYATNVTTELFFRQAVGRLVRVAETDPENAIARMFIPDDPRLRSHAELINQERQHALSQKENIDYELRPGGDALERASMFIPLSAEMEDKGTIADGATFSSDELAKANQLIASSVMLTGIHPEQVADVIRRTSATNSVIETVERVTASEPSTFEQLARLRSQNNDLAKAIALWHNVEHKIVNATLNRAQGVKIRRLSEAGKAQLERRLHEASEWRRTGTPPGE